jgi:hypothetical protein
VEEAGYLITDEERPVAEPENSERFVVQVPSGQYNIQVESGQYNVAGGDTILTPEQRGLLQRAIEKVLTALHFVEVVVEVASDGTIRVGVRSRP